MEKHLGDIITKDEARAIVLFAIGREATEDELSETLVHYFEPSPLLTEYYLQQQLEIPIFLNDNEEDPTMRIVIYKNGLVEYRNWSGTIFQLLNPIEIYKIILSHEEDFSNLSESI